MSKNMKTCPICEEGQVNETSRKRHVEYKGYKGSVPLYFSICDTCGSEQGDAAQSRRNKQAMQAFKKQADGFLSGTEIKTLRKHWNITQGQAAKIFGGGPVAFSKYEIDDVIQSESMDKLLRVAQSVPQAFFWLAQQAGEHEICHQARQRSFELMESMITRKDKRVVPFKTEPRLITSGKSDFDLSGHILAVG